MGLGTCGQAHGCLLTGCSPSLQEHPLNTKCSGDGGSCPALLAPTMSEGRQWEAEEAVRVVVKMTRKEDCSRVSARVLSGRAGEREVVMGYILERTGPILGPTKVVGLWLHFSATLCLTHSEEIGFEGITGWFLLRGTSGGGGSERHTHDSTCSRLAPRQHLVPHNFKQS